MNNSVRFQIFCILIFFCFEALAKPGIIWLRPLEAGVIREGTQIVGGDHYEIMTFIANQIDTFEHSFESYPVKRNWRFIQNASNGEQVYCFYGAGYDQQRESWGIYSSPTAIGLAYLVVAPKGLVNSLANDGIISLENLFENGYKTVLYDQVTNLWVERVKQYDFPGSVMQITGIDTNLSKHTIQLILKRRIDFGYVAHNELSALTKDAMKQLSVFQIREFSEQVRQTKRILCSRSTLGQTAIRNINKALVSIRQDADKDKTFMELNFRADGYDSRYKSIYEKLWDKWTIVDSEM